MRLSSTIFFTACLAGLGCLANAQSPRELLGKIVTGDDQSQSPLDSVKIVLDESGSHDISKDGGLFQLFLPDVLKAGDEITITATAPGYAIYEPPGGKLNIPSDLDLPRKRVLIQLLAKGSPKFLSDAQLRAFVERSAKESNRQSSQPGPKEHPDLSRYLRDWAIQYGFSIDQVRAELDRWAADVSSRKASAYDRALAAFAKNNFHESNERALDDAAEAEANLASLQKQQQEDVDRAIRDYRLAGDAAFNDLGFEKAASAYSNALSHAARERNATQWADLQIRIGNAEGQLTSRSEGAQIHRHAEAGIKAYSLALEVYKRETLPQDWAMATNNLGIALHELAVRSEGPQAETYLEQAVAAYRNSLEVTVTTREQPPQDWALTQNNLGNALRDLALRSEGLHASSYLEQAMAAFRNALQVFTREQLPEGWATTQVNLGGALHDLAMRSEGPQAAAYLEQAVATFRNALQVRTRDQLPQDWAATQNNLGVAFRDLAERSEGPEAPVDLEEALAAFRSALQVRTRDRLPQDWAATENNLGVALAVLGKMSKGPQATGYLEEAVGTFRNALQVRTRDQLPQGWAATQNNLGASLHDLAVRSEGPQAAAYMEQAVAAFRNALQVRTEANFPGQWLLTMINLAHTYEISRDWNNARESYERLLHHDPNNAYFQEKFRELEEKH